MPGLFVFIANPTQNSTVGRSLQVSGSIGQINGAINFVGIQFGVGGPTVTITPHHGVWTWFWQGLLPNNIRPGQAFQIIVTARGTMITKPGPEPETADVDGQAIANVLLENVVPVLTVNPFQSPIVVIQLPYAFTLSGTVSEGNGPPYGVSQVQFQIGNGPPTNLAVSQGNWSVALSLQPGDYPLTVRASDPFASVTTFQKTLTVLRFTMPGVVDPNAKKTLNGVPTTSSITSWTRLEPQCSNADIGASTSARLFDPLWLMTRQWQMGEFQAEDTGSPVQAHVRATNAALTRCYFGELSKDTSAPPYDPTHAPLETLVERRRMRAADANDSRMLTLAVEAGLHFLRMLELNATATKYRSAFLAHYAMQPLPSQATAIAEDATKRFVQVTAGRAPDARLLAAAFRHMGTPQIVFDASLNIAAADASEVQQVATEWLAWYDGLFAEPANPAEDAWNPSRLEYAVSVWTRLSAQPQDALTFSASEFDGGRLDWSSFDVNGKFNIDTTGDHTFVALNERTVPSPVSFRGAPAARFWEMEDANIAYGLLPAGPTDLAHLLMIEYASTYGNDWYVVPLTIPVGSVTRVDTLVVTDTFGVRSLLRPIGDPALPEPHFSMWQSARMHDAGDQIGGPVSNRFLLPPTIGRSIDGPPLEDVLFMRDEMANLAWGIERSIESALEPPVNLANGSTTTAVAPSSATPADPGAPPRYLLSTTVPDNWVPLLPVELDDHGALVSRLKRGAVLQPDGTNKVHQVRGEALNASADLLLYDEEVPREGVHITRRRRMTRWIDGSTWVWTAFRNEIGTGEGSAGLCFDQLEGDRPP
jgi:hypothetical protein